LNVKKISRREFIHLIAKSAGAAAVMQLLHARGIAPAVASGTPTNTPFVPSGPQVTNLGSIAGAVVHTETPIPDATAQPTGLPATVTAAPAAKPAYLAVARGGDDPEALVRSAVDAIGGIGRFVPSGANVLIKPNICVASHNYKLAATTNPWVVGALVRMCLEAGAGRVLVYDFPFDKSLAQAYTDSGIADQVAAAGGEMEYVDSGKFRSILLPGAQSLGSAAFYSEVIDADVVINVPIAKHHRTTGLTLGMKNMMGVIKNRDAIHASDIHRRIADLAEYIRPELNVIDAVRIRIADGPDGWSPNDVRKVDTVIASADIVAADAYATRLFGWTDPNRLGYVKIGAERGLGRSDLENLKIEEITLG
jgi:uncharacterized protein (DUF362 family)